MTLEINPWARQERLERIAGAERDRRAGRLDLALATLGDATEWPARVVAALANLPEGEGLASRAMLEETLDLWAAEAGVAAALQEEAAPNAEAIAEDAAQIEEALLVEDVATDTLDEDLLVAPPLPTTPALLAEPIEADELERAFASAEAQVEEMHDVNDVAERVLADEPVGLAELAEPGDAGLAEIEGGDAHDVALADVEVFGGDAAAALGGAGLGLGAGAALGFDVEEMDAATSGDGIWPSEPVVASDPDTDPDIDGGSARSSRTLATLERWLGNLEARKQRVSIMARGEGRLR